MPFKLTHADGLFGNHSRGGGRHRRRRAQVLQVLPGPRPRRRGGGRRALPAALPGDPAWPRAPLRRRGRAPRRAQEAGGHLLRRRRGSRRPRRPGDHRADPAARPGDRKSTRLNSSHVEISYAVFCLKKKKKKNKRNNDEKKKHTNTKNQ